MENEILRTMEIRPLKIDDNLKQVADLIYSSDNYIYPYLFDNDLSVAERVLVNMILGDTIYNYKNIRIALSSGKIIAMIITKHTPFKVSYETMIDCFIKAHVPVGVRFAKVFKDYFGLLEDEPPDVYIANLAVDKMFRHVGVGRKLMESIFHDHLTYHLEVVKANLPAIKLYETLDFAIDCEYPGFTDIPCYRMTRHAKP